MTKRNKLRNINKRISKNPTIAIIRDYNNHIKFKEKEIEALKGEKKSLKDVIKFDKKENPFKKLLSLNLNK